MKKKILITLIFLLLAGAVFFYTRFQSQVPMLKVNDPELTTLLSIMDKYRSTDVQIIWEGSQSTPALFWNFSIDYLKHNFNSGDDAKTWIENHCYRTSDGQVIYFKYPDGTTRLMRDVFLEELAAMRSEPSQIPLAGTDK